MAAPKSEKEDALLKELDKLSRLSAFSSRPGSKSVAKNPDVSASLDALLSTLHAAKDGLAAGTSTPADIAPVISKSVDQRRGEIEDRQKEVYNALTKFGRSLDKKFPNPVPPSIPVFNNPKSEAALERTIAMHFIRTGSFDVAEVFGRESSVELPSEIPDAFVHMHQVIQDLRRHDVERALQWVNQNREHLISRGSPLEFYLHRSRYLHLLLNDPSSPPLSALDYAKRCFPALFPAHSAAIQRLLTAIIYHPPSRLQNSPYADFTSPEIHAEVIRMFEKEYCARLGLSCELPLRIAGDIGGGGALARIEKGRKVMRDKKSEWSQTDELPIEIPLQPRHRYHSVFACPVSKEQSTEANPPMMLACNHVVAQDSLRMLSKSPGRVKCPYCPSETTNPALRVYF
jgi:hypothetical protein